MPSAAELAAPLFAPLTVNSMRLPNRIVMAPMTREFSPGGLPGADVAQYYARRARHGVGLVVTEGTVVDHPASSSSDAVPRFHGEDALACWAEVVAAVHAEGGRIVPQLWHVGVETLLYEGGDRPGDRGSMPAGATEASPSGIIPPDRRIGEPMTESDIADVVDAFARAAADAKRLGFDGVELHGAHGYLIDAFLWGVTNRRGDAYGGGVAERTRFAAEIVRACRAAGGPDLPISFRLSQWKVGAYEEKIAHDEHELEAILGPLVDAGVDLFHCSTRRFWRPEFEGSPLNLAGWTKKISGRPTVTVGSVGLEPSDFLTYLEGKGARAGGLEEIVARVERGEFDLVAVGRALLADPEWAEKIQQGRVDELVGFQADALDRLT